MTMVSTGEISRFPYTQDESGIAAALLGFTFDTSTDQLSVIFHIAQTGTIANVHYRISTSTTPSCTFRCELRTVDATTGLPNAAGTLYGSSTSITQTNPTTGNKTAAVNCTGATAGDLVALVFDLSVYTSGSFVVVQRHAGAVAGGAGMFPYDALSTAGSLAVAINAFNTWALEYTGGLYYPLERNMIVATATTTTVTNSGVTRRGNRFRSTVPRRAVGVWVYLDMDGDVVLRLRLQSDDSILATATLDKDVRGGAAGGPIEVFFDARATYNLAAGVEYYVLVEGTTATAATIYSIINIPANAQLDQLNGGHNIYGTSYNSGYTDVDTSRYYIGILYDGLDDGVQVGSLLRHPGMAGGLNA